jgi:hypothetical protein
LETAATGAKYVPGYKVYSHAVGMPQECRYLKVRPQIEQQRSLNFALEAGALYSDGALCSTLQVNRSLLLVVLAEIKVTFESCASKHGKYSSEPSKLEGNSEDGKEPDTDLMELLFLSPDGSTSPKQVEEKRFKLMRKLGTAFLQSSRNVRTLVTEPKRLVWATLDKAILEALLAKLMDLNSFLIALLDGSQIKRLQKAMDNSYQEILQIRNDVQSLTSLLKALRVDEGEKTRQPVFGIDHDSVIASAAAEESQVQEKKRRYLQRLTEIKILYNRIGDDENNALSTKVALDLDDFVFESKDDGDKFIGRENSTYGGQHVWIEWKPSQFSL